MNDCQLLKRYVDQGDQQAFAELVRLHLDVVYSAARRQARGDAALAEEITQQVFIVFAAKAATLSDEVLIGGWLYNTARFVARDELRKVRRRTQHEQGAAAMANEHRMAAAPAKSDPWSEAETVLDEAMASLDEQNRGLLVHRFLQGRSTREVAQRFGLTEEAARKRISRAVEQLREMFARRGVVMSATALAEALAVKTIVHAPAHLAASAMSAATSGAATPAAVAKAGVTLTAAIKAHAIAASIAGVVLLGGGVVGGIKVIGYLYSPAQPRTVRVTAPAPQGPTISGTVRDATGQPVATAELLVVGRGTSINIYDAPAAGVVIPKTAEDGTFALAVPPDHFQLIVRSPQGYAEVSAETLAKSTDVRLDPWARIEGRVLAGNAPLPNVAIHAFESPPDTTQETVMRQAQTRTDSDGRFTFARVASGEVRLAQQDPLTMRFHRWTYAVVDAGKTATVTIGGSGRPVIGRFVNPPGAAPLLWDYKSQKFSPMVTLQQTNGPAFRRPEHRPGETLEEWRAVEEAFGRTPEGAQIKRMAIGTRDVGVNPDGSFRIDDVPAGEYALSAGILHRDAAMDATEDVARGVATVRVEPMLGVRSDQPLDLGSIRMTTVPHLRPGDAVTPFDFTMLDGSIKNVTDFGGKHLFVVFVSPAKGFEPGVDAFARLAAGYASDPRLQVLWLNISSPAEAAASAKTHGLLGLVASVAGNELPQEYDALVACGVLVDPAGKLVQKRLSPDSARKQLQQALGAATARK